MNNYVGEGRKRNRNLLVVEGNHEKNKLFWLMLKCFPEINIKMEDMWIYGTNIYLLYEDIAKEYGDDWADEADDIDLPFVISKKQHPDLRAYKRDFTNIILVFDYERHDKNFSERKILEMQNYFNDATNRGKLYINYPMIESYQHLKGLPDWDYAERKIPVSLRPGKKYKALVRNETVIEKEINFPHKLDDLLHKEFEMVEMDTREACCEAILNIAREEDINDRLKEILQKTVKNDRQDTLRYMLKDWLIKRGYVHAGQTYWEHIRNIFKQIIYHNICKAYRIQNGQYKIEKCKYRKCFEELDMANILEIQNLFSQNPDTGYIWVLNTCVFFVAEYDFKLIAEIESV